MNASDAFEEFASRLRESGGFTYDHRVPADQAWVSEGYALSINPECTQIVDVFNARALANFYADNWDTLKQDGKMFGAWLDTETGKTHLDVVTIYTDRDKAIADGRFYGELAIFDLSAGEEIRLSYEVGDEDPFPWGRESLDDEDPGCDAEDTFLCTMRSNHNSPHVGGNGRIILGVWDK